MLSANEIVSLHDQLNQDWHGEAVNLDEIRAGDWLDLVTRQHRANFDLWHIEDEARGLPNCEAPLNSESPGLIIDRLSILALKIYHTGEEADRLDAPAGHGQRNRARLDILSEQRAD